MIETRLYQNILYTLRDYSITLPERNLLTHAKNMLESGQDFDSIINSLKNGMDKQEQLSATMLTLSNFLSQATAA